MRWWGPFSLDDPGSEPATGRWQIGPLELWVARTASGVAGRPTGHEWRLAVDYDPDPDIDRAEVELPAGRWAPPASAKILRYASPPGDPVLELAARLPDRDLVVRADPPVHLVAGHEVQVFVGTPVWVAVRTGGEDLVQLPTVRLPETWFGPSPREGELCYALRSRARLAVAEIPRRANRAIGVLSVRNEGPNELLLERLKVPVPNLALYRSGNGTLWCQQISVVRPFGGDEAVIEVTEGPPEIAGEVELEMPARRIGSPNLLIRALGELLA